MVLQTHVCNIISSNTEGPHNDYLTLQDNPLSCKPMALVERIIKEIGQITKEYTTRKRIAEKKDKDSLNKSIELLKRELDSKAEEDLNGEKELAYLQESLKNLNADEVQHAAREKSKETQYKASCISAVSYTHLTLPTKRKV